LNVLDANTFTGNSFLQSLHLSDNKLTSSCLKKALNPLVNLQKLWLNENRLTSLSGFGKLSCLRSLWVCRNKIERIGDQLKLNVNLEELNIADNRIGCFKEILHLSNAQSLRSLALNDPHFGTNPVCSLCNYQTYALYHLNQITSLDNEYISDEAKVSERAL